MILHRHNPIDFSNLLKHIMQVLLIKQERKLLSFMVILLSSSRKFQKGSIANFMMKKVVKKLLEAKFLWIPSENDTKFEQIATKDNSRKLAMLYRNIVLQGDRNDTNKSLRKKI